MLQRAPMNSVHLQSHSQTSWIFPAAARTRAPQSSTAGSARRTPATAAPAVNALRHARTVAVLLASAESTSTATRSRFPFIWWRHVAVRRASKATLPSMGSQGLAIQRHCSMATSFSVVIGLEIQLKTARFHSLLSVASAVPRFCSGTPWIESSWTTRTCLKCPMTTMTHSTSVWFYCDVDKWRHWTQRRIPHCKWTPLSSIYRLSRSTQATGNFIRSVSLEACVIPSIWILKLPSHIYLCYIDVWYHTINLVTLMCITRAQWLRHWR